MARRPSAAPHLQALSAHLCQGQDSLWPAHGPDRRLGREFRRAARAV